MCQVPLSFLVEMQSQTHQDGGSQRLQDFLLLDAAQEPQRRAPQELVGVLQVVAQVLADEDLRCSNMIALTVVRALSVILQLTLSVTMHTTMPRIAMQHAGRDGTYDDLQVAALTISGKIFPFASVFSIVSCQCKTCAP